MPLLSRTDEVFIHCQKQMTFGIPFSSSGMALLNKDNIMTECLEECVLFDFQIIVFYL